MKDKNRQIHTIGVGLNLSYASGRDLLYGISAFAKRNCHWNIHLINFSQDYSEQKLDSLNGIITSEPLPSQFVTDHPEIPIVIIGPRSAWLKRRMIGISFVRNDDVDIGRYAGKFLTRLGKFRSFGFVPTNIPYYCSTLRSEGFRKFLSERGMPVTEYKSTSAADGSLQDIEAIGCWLKSLPKPAAVMAVHDIRATHVLEAAVNTEIKVPEAVAVIGVDNDELLCDFTEPRLTSVFPDHVHEGELAAAELKRALSRNECLNRTRTIRSKKKSIVERGSTANISPAAHLVDTAQTYIARNAVKGISVRDVVKHLGVSRRLADLRFRECTGKTILETIQEVKLEELKRILTISADTIKKITRSCGFNDEIHAKHLFKRKFGMTMREWRQQHP